MKEKRKPIQYLSSLTGSGKSEHVIDKIANDDEKYIIVAPNRELCDELYARLIYSFNTNIEPEVDALVVHQNTNDKPSKHLKNNVENNTTVRILITTHAAFFLMLNKTIDVSEWNLILDEEMPIFEEHEINVTKYTKPIIEETLNFEKSKDDGFYNVSFLSTMFGLNHNAGVVRDSFLANKPYSKLSKHILDDKYDTLVSSESLEFFDNAELDTSGKKFTKFYAISILRMEILYKFKSILVLCSFFEKTVTYKLLKCLGCELVPYYYLPDMREHANTEKITIHYFFDMNWSTTLRKTRVNKKKTVEELVYENIKALVGNEKFLYNANVNFRQSIKGGTLAASTHGINKYKTYTELVFMPSLNATSATVKLLSKFGMKRQDIDFARNVLTAYQFASRGAIRDVNNTKDVNLYVMDKRTATFLKSVFTKAKLKNHAMDDIVKNKGITKKVPNNVKSFMSRVRKRLNDGDAVRPATLQKYREYYEDYYNG